MNETCGSEALLQKREAEIDRLRKHVDDLQSGMYVNCVYCGHRYGPGETTPVSMADALKAHVEQCPEHPMSALKRENEQLRERTPASVDWLDEARESCLIDGVRYRASAAAGYAVERLLARWEASLKDWTATSNELVGDAGMVRQLREAIEADRREGREDAIPAWLTYRGPGQGIYVREYEAGGRTWYRDGEGMNLLPGESVKVRILVPTDQHPQGGET